jgi:hypothetical protein
MNMLTSYDQAMAVLSAALKSKDIVVVLKGRDDLDMIKLRARQLRDRQLLADATEFQMRVERWLGELLNEAVASGHLHGVGRRCKEDWIDRPATLLEIGIDAKLSMKARHAAGLDQDAFNAAVSKMRARMASGKATLVHAVDHSRKGEKRHRASREKVPGFGFLLSDGTPLGHVKLGKLRSRIEQLSLDLKILAAISDHVGSGADALASVEESISEASVNKIVNEAKVDVLQMSGMVPTRNRKNSE